MSKCTFEEDVLEQQIRRVSCLQELRAVLPSHQEADARDSPPKERWTKIGNCKSQILERIQFITNLPSFPVAVQGADAAGRPGHVAHAVQLQAHQDVPVLVPWPAVECKLRLRGCMNPASSRPSLAGNARFTQPLRGTLEYIYTRICL